MKEDDKCSSDAPAANMRSQCAVRTLQDEAAFEFEAAMIVVDIGGSIRQTTQLQFAMATTLDITGVAMEVTDQKAAACKYLMKLLCKLANTVLDADIGEML